MKNKVWTFGDSFTEGTLCDYSQWQREPGMYDSHQWGVKARDFYKKYPGHKNWTTRIAEHLDLKLMNRGSSGDSSDGIFNSVIKNGASFKKGDWVFILDSNPIRFMGINESKKTVETINMEESYTLFDGEGWKYTMSGLLEGFSKLKPHQWKFWDNTTIGKETKAKLLIDYASEFILNNPHIWSQYHIEKFSNLVLFLNNMGVNAYFTWSGLWNSKYFNGDLRFHESGYIFKTIHDEFHWGDDHFGYEGNIQFFEYLKHKIQEKQFVNPSEWTDTESIKELMDKKRHLL